MPITEKDVDSLAEARIVAEQVLADAKAQADTLRAAHARAVLMHAFPHYSLAVYQRIWDQDRPRLLRLLADADAPSGVEDLDVPALFAAELGPNRAEQGLPVLSTEELQALDRAESAIAAIGSDDDVLEVLDAGEQEHEDWFEFTLALGEKPIEAESAADA